VYAGTHTQEGNYAQFDTAMKAREAALGAFCVLLGRMDNEAEDEEEVRVRGGHGGCLRAPRGLHRHRLSAFVSTTVCAVCCASLACVHTPQDEDEDEDEEEDSDEEPSLEKLHAMARCFLPKDTRAYLETVRAVCCSAMCVAAAV
jgi:hypothetical protein